MCPHPAQGREGPGFDPLRAPGFAVLRAEIVSAIALGSQHHGGRALRSNLGIETLDRDGAVQHSAVQSVMVGDGSQIVVLAIAGRHRLRVEELWIDEVGMLRREVKRAGDRLG